MSGFRAGLLAVSFNFQFKDVLAAWLSAGRAGCVSLAGWAGWAGRAGRAGLLAVSFNFEFSIFNFETGN